MPDEKTKCTCKAQLQATNVQQGRWEYTFLAADLMSVS